MSMYKVLLSIFVMFFMSSIYGRQGHATFYEFKSHIGIKSEFEGMYEAGVQHVFSDMNYRLFRVGVHSYGGDIDYSIGIDYGHYFRLSSISKGYVSSMITLYDDLNFSNNNELDALIGLRCGWIRRLSSRWSFLLDTSVPLVSTRSSSIFLSVGVNYFYGSGVQYRETSKYV